MWCILGMVQFFFKPAEPGGLQTGHDIKVRVDFSHAISVVVFMASRILVVLLVKVVDMSCQMKRRFPGRESGFQIVYVAHIILSPRVTCFQSSLLLFPKAATNQHSTSKNTCAGHSSEEYSNTSHQRVGRLSM